MDPRRQAEASRAASTFHVAMAMLGAEAMSEVLSLWQSVVPMTTRVVSTGAAFVEEALQAIRVRRHQVQAIVIPFMRLFRALQTGYTFQAPFAEEAPERVPLATLRQDFIQAVERWAPDALVDSEIPDPDPTDEIDETVVIDEPDGSPYIPYRIAEWVDTDEVVNEEIQRLEELLEEEERRAEAEAEGVLENLGVKLLQERLQREAEQATAEALEAEATREQEHAKIGRRVAAHAERLAQNGGRHARAVIGSADKRVIGFVRVHYPEKDPHPCGFCALLISRGLWRIYRSKQTAALVGSDFDEYHPKCHCTIEEVYSKEYFNTGKRFDLNREYRALWDSRPWSMTEWRAHFRQLADQASAETQE